jgi:parallel beta-helix repeat protein
VISVKDYGAIGDGVTDDTLAIAEALAANLNVYFPEGTYICGPLTLRSGHNLHGAGQEAAIIKHATDTNGFNGNAVSNVRISSMTINGDSANNLTSGIGVNITGASSHITLSDVRLTDWRQDGFAAGAGASYITIDACRSDSNMRDGASFTGVSNPLVDGCKLFSNGRFGAVFGSCDNVRLADSVLIGNSATDSGGAGAAAVNATDAVFSDNIASSNVLGHGLQFNTVTRGTMAGNISQNNGISGLDSYGGTYVTITGNVSYENTVRGIEIDSGAYYNTVSGNVVYRNGEVGISIFRSPNTTIANNYATENGAISSPKYGIRLWDSGGNLPSSNCRLIGNVASDDRGASSTQAYGVSLEDGANDITMIANRLIPNVIGAVTMPSGSFNACEGNQGYRSAATVLTLQNGWVSYAATWEPPQSFVDAAGVVVVSGTMKNGTTTAGTVVATLPTGSRPAKVAGPFICFAEGTLTSFYVLPNGNIVANGPMVSSRTSLCGITFKV